MKTEDLELNDLSVPMSLQEKKIVAVTIVQLKETFGELRAQILQKATGIRQQ